jgi:hypothetical protein
MDADDRKDSAAALGTILDQALIRDAERKEYERRRTRFEEICATAVRRTVNAAIGESDAQKPAERSLYRNLLFDMAEAAAVYALDQRIEPDDFRFGVLSDALQVVEGLRFAVVRDWTAKTLDFFDANASPLEKIKAGAASSFNRAAVEASVGDYLVLPFRCQPLDRFLVHIVIAMELYTFANDMVNENTYGLFPAHSPLKQRHALWDYGRNVLLAAILLGGIAAAAIGAASSGLLTKSAARWIVGMALSSFLLLNVVITIVLPFTWHKQRKARRQVRDLIGTMNTLFTELNSAGPISAGYIRDRAIDITNKGVVWPAPLFSLLDDIAARTGRF